MEFLRFWGCGTVLRRSIRLSGWTNGWGKWRLDFSVCEYLRGVGGWAVDFRTWYDQLKKPAWTPRPGTISRIWTGLYVLIVVSFGFTFYQAATAGRLPGLVALPLVGLLVTAVDKSLGRYPSRGREGATCRTGRSLTVAARITSLERRRIF